MTSSPPPPPPSPQEFGSAYLDWLRDEEAAGAPLIPAATVVLLRDTADGIETRETCSEAQGTSKVAASVGLPLAGGTWAVTLHE